MKRTPLKRGTSQLKRSGFKPKARVWTKNAGKVAKRFKSKGSSSRLPTLKSLRDKCDKFLTPICKKTTPHCEACGKHTEVGHHWIEKSRSSYLRYDLRNIVALCNSCHTKIHNRFGNSVVGGLDVAQIIIKKRGKTWKMQMDADQPNYVKIDRNFYMENMKRLQAVLEYDIVST